MAWPMTLWQDYLAAQAAGPQAEAAWIDAYAYHKGAVQPSETMSVVAPCCGRRAAADTVIDARGIPGTVVRGADQPWLCDSCWTRMLRSQGNGWTRSRWYRALGAPAHIIRDYRARELAAERIRALPRGTTYNRKAEVDQALTELPQGIRDLPGTAHPNAGG